MNSRTRLIFGIFGLFLFLVATWQILKVRSELDVTTTHAGEMPVEIIAPKGENNSDRPIVLIGHGFAGSGVIMRGFAYTLAKAGYVAVLWDFDGHGGNPRPLSSGLSRGDLLPNAEQALAKAVELGIGDPAHVAILGHSMGSGVALSYGQKHPDTRATIAVSPVGTAVSQELPHNLLLLAGENEPAFQQNAQERLAEAGGEGGDPALGTARKLVIIPLVEHISIVFSPQSHREARQWLDLTFGAQPGALDYTDHRIGWYGLGVLGVVLAAGMLIPSSQAVQGKLNPAFWKRLLALLLGTLGATGLLWALGLAGLDLTRSLGMTLGGYLLAWFGIAGIISCLLMEVFQSGGLFSRRSMTQAWTWITTLRGRIIASGLLVAGALWLGFGLLGGQVWLPWLLIPQRLALWPLGVVCMLPWFMTVGQAASRANGWGRLGWWAAQSAAIVVSLVLTMLVTPGVYFLSLILPVFPLILGVHAAAAGRQRSAWAFGLSAAMFASWALLAVFPLN